MRNGAEQLHVADVHPWRKAWAAALTPRGKSVSAGCRYSVSVDSFRFLLEESGDAVNDFIQRGVWAEARESV